MNKVMRRALRAAVLSAGAWAERATPDGITTIFAPHIPAGVKALNRAGRSDLIASLIRRCNKKTRYDVTSLNDAKYLASHDLKEGA